MDKGIRTRQLDELEYIEKPGDEAGITFDDPSNPRKFLCVGIEYEGGDRRSPDSYRIDHVNHWTDSINGEDEEIEENIGREKLEKILRAHGTSTRNALAQCLSEYFDEQ